MRCCTKIPSIRSVAISQTSLLTVRHISVLPCLWVWWTCANVPDFPYLGWVSCPFLNSHMSLHRFAVQGTYLGLDMHLGCLETVCLGKHISAKIRNSGQAIRLRGQKNVCLASIYVLNPVCLNPSALWYAYWCAHLSLVPSQIFSDRNTSCC